MFEISIIIPVFNRWNFTKSCLNDLFKLNLEIHEIIVVDNASSDQTVEEMTKLTQKHKNLIYIRNAENFGFAKGCNIGYKASKGKIIIFLNNDIKVRKYYNNWTDIVIKTLYFTDNQLVGPTGGKVDPKNEFRFMYETNSSNKDINYMSGWCLAATRNTFDDLIINGYSGPFSEEFGIAYFEDTDLSFRAAQQNIIFKLVDIPVVHFGKITSSQLNTHTLYNNARKIFIDKWSKNDITK
jgi:GT2 family glycosyltransferase